MGSSAMGATMLRNKLKDAHNGLWNAEAEKILFRHFGVK